MQTDASRLLACSQFFVLLPFVLFIFLLGGLQNKFCYHSKGWKGLERIPRLDVVVDDASHLNWHQRLAFEALYPCLNPEGGVYIVEDISVSDFRFQWGGCSFLGYPGEGGLEGEAEGKPIMGWYSQEIPFWNLRKWQSQLKSSSNL